MKYVLISISSLVMMGVVLFFFVPDLMEDPTLFGVFVVAALVAAASPLLPLLLRGSKKGRKTVWATDEGRFLMIERDASGTLSEFILAGRVGLDEYGRHLWGVRRVKIEDGKPSVVWNRPTGWKSSTAPAMVDGLIIAGRPEWKGVMAIDPQTGEIAWEVPTEAPLNQHHTPLLRGGLLHIVEEETGRWFDIRPVSGEIINDGRYSTDSEWEAVRESHDSIAPPSLLAWDIQLGQTKISVTSSIMRDDGDEIEVEPIEDYHEPEIRRPDLPSAPMDPEQSYGSTMKIPTVDAAASIGMYGDNLLVLDSKEGFGGDRKVAFVVVNWPDLNEVARFPVDRPGKADGSSGPSIDYCYEVDGLLVVVIDRLEESSGRAYGEEGWIIDPETWTRVCWLPETCDSDNDEFAEIILYDRSDAEVGRIVI